MCICVNESVKDDDKPNCIFEWVFFLPPPLYRSEAGNALGSRGYSMCVVPPFFWACQHPCVWTLPGGYELCVPGRQSGGAAHQDPWHHQRKPQVKWFVKSRYYWLCTLLYNCIYYSSYCWEQKYFLYKAATIDSLSINLQIIENAHVILNLLVFIWGSVQKPNRQVHVHCKQQLFSLLIHLEIIFFIIQKIVKNICHSFPNHQLSFTFVTLVLSNQQSNPPNIFKFLS